MFDSINQLSSTIKNILCTKNWFRKLCLDPTYPLHILKFGHTRCINVLFQEDQANCFISQYMAQWGYTLSKQ